MKHFKKPISIALSLILTVNSFCTMSLPVMAAGTTPENGNIYYIKNVNSGKYLQVENNSASNGANVCQANGTGDLGQKWIVNTNSDGSVRLKSAVDMTGGVALDIPNGKGDNLVNVQTWASNGLTPQNFKLESDGSGAYAIKTAASNYARCLDVIDWSTKDGANVVQYDCFMNANQLWYFEEASWPGSSSKAEPTTETTTKAPASSSASASSTSWNFSNSAFRSLGTISSDTSVNGITLKATSSKTMSVRAENAEVNGNSYTYCLALGGSGSTSYRAIKAKANGATTVKLTARSSGSSARTLVIADSKGKTLAQVSCPGSATLATATINYTGDIYIYSANSGINIYKLQIDTKGTAVETTTEATTKVATTTTAKATTTTKKVTTTTEKATTTTTKKVTTTTEKATETTTAAVNGTVVKDFASLQSAVKSLASKGGTIYVNAKELSCSSQLALDSTKGKAISIVGMRQSDGTYPVLNFKPLRDSMIGTAGGSLKASGDSSVGVRITGSNYTLKNLIIEKAGDNGIQIKGSNANYNTVENCIVRYNNDAGVQITAGASNNTMKFVYSYRNCDVYTLGGNSDGFAPKLGATTGNKFYGCYAWDNSDDGWDSYDKTDSGYTKDLTYEWCACWNNGNPDVFTGAYDFSKGKSLDKNLFLVELICKQDSNFANNYSKGKLNLPTASFIKTGVGTVNLSTWTGSKYDGNPNGFKFGSINSGSSLVRKVNKCLAFEHGSKGFDNNNSACTGYFSNCVSYDNGYNYYLPKYTLKSWDKIVGFDGKSGDKLPSGYKASAPSNEARIRSYVEATREAIVSRCNQNIIPGEIYFDIF